MAAILRSVLSMSAATALSRITGYVRTFTQAAVVGSGTVVAEAYTYSNSLPNQIYELFMGGILSSIFIPLLVERLSRHGERDARLLANALATLVVPFLALITLLGIVFAPALVGFITDWKASSSLSPAEAERTTELAVLLFRVFAAQIFFYGVAALEMGILNAHRRFFLPAFTPVLNNLIVIASFGGYALLSGAHPSLALRVLAFGTTLGVAAMALAMLPAVLRLGYRPRPVFGHPSLAPAARLAGPMLVFVVCSVGVQVAANYFGSAAGGVSDLWYAFMIFQLPYGIFTVSMATALMPELSESYARRDAASFRSTLSFGLRTMTFVLAPAAVGMIALSRPIVGLLYEHGNFTGQDTLSVSVLLAAYAVGLLGYAAYFVLVRSFYSRQNTRAPATLNAGLLVLYVVLGHLLLRWLGLVGVALAFSISYTILALALLLAMRRVLKRLGGRGMLRSFSRIVLSAAGMYVTARAGLALTGPGPGLLGHAAVLVGVGGVSLAVYLAVAALLRTEELGYALSLLRRKAAAGKG
ncbi:MAG: murein biosynthesis integral membrane protein MurJ [Rubrobacteraceae bacterium]|nr:murein biosynthesis integral membrane protein MurJ [Rubrobacteraceae bacterium]